MPASGYGPYNPGMAPTPAPFGQAGAAQIFQGAAPGGQLPSSPGGGGLDIAGINSFINEIGASSGITADDVTKAYTPISQAAPTQMPSYFSRQIANPPPARVSRGAVGAGAARGQGIGNTISASISALAQFKANHERQQLESQGNQVHRFLEAQEGLDQSKQIIAQGPQTPGYQEAQANLKKNQDLMNGMLSDKKFVKTLEKGFDISLTDPSQNKTPEHGIVQKGLDLFRQSKDQKQPFSPEQVQQIAQKFQSQRPQMLGPNVQAQQMLQQKMAMQKANTDYAKAFMPMLVQQSKFQQAQTLQNAKQAFDAGMATFNAAKAFELQNRRFTQAKDLAGQQYDKAVALEGMREASRMRLLTTTIASKWDNPLAQQQLINATNKEYEAGMDKFEGRKNYLQNQITYLLGGTTAGTDAVKDQINDIKAKIKEQDDFEKTLKENHDKSMKAIGEIIKGGKPDAGAAGIPTPDAASGANAGRVPPAADPADPVNAATQEDLTSYPGFDPSSDSYSNWVFAQ